MQRAISPVVLNFLLDKVAIKLNVEKPEAALPAALEFYSDGDLALELQSPATLISARYIPRVWLIACFASTEQKIYFHQENLFTPKVN